MRKAKSVSRKVKSEKIDAIISMHLSLEVERKYTIESYAPKSQAMAYGFIGAIRQLMATHNALLESSRGLSAANQSAIHAAAATLEAQVDQRIDSLNEFLEREESTYQKRKKLSKTKSAIKRRAMRKNETKQQKKKRLKKRRAGLEKYNRISKIESQKTGKKIVSKKSKKTNARRKK